jgi:hypothetical protein
MTYTYDLNNQEAPLPPTTKLWLAIIRDRKKTPEDIVGFMQRQITERQNWLRVETTQGTQFFSVADTSLFVRDSRTQTHPLTEDERAATIKKIQQYTEGAPQEWENIKGYGARLSAPGYLNCTEWAVFDTAEEAQQYLEENYSEDEDENTGEN